DQPGTGGEEYRHHAERGRLPVEVQRVPEVDRRVLAPPVEMLEKCGHLEVGRVSAPGDDPQLLGAAQAGQVLAQRPLNPGRTYSVVTLHVSSWHRTPTRSAWGQQG